MAGGVNLGNYQMYVFDDKNMSNRYSPDDGGRGTL